VPPAGFRTSGFLPPSRRDGGGFRDSPAGNSEPERRITIKIMIKRGKGGTALKTEDEDEEDYD